MGRENEVPKVVGSSIVLLQERFKQLQKLKEMREGRQILQLSPRSTEVYEVKTGSHDPDLALGLNSGSIHTAYYQAVYKPEKFPSAKERGAHKFFEKPDVVDTSLHL